MNHASDGSSACFVVSTGRCGSTFVSEILGAHRGIVSLSELLFSMGPEPFPSGMISGERFAAMLAHCDPLVTLALRRHAEPIEFRYPVDAGLRFDRRSGVPAVATITLPALTDEPDAAFDDLIAFARSSPPAPIGVQYLRLFGWFRGRFGGGRWVERTGGSLHLLPGLIEHFPEARFVHLYRDGRETAISMSKRDNFRLMLVGLEIQRITGVNPYTVPEPPPMPDLPEPLAKLTPASLDLDELRRFEIPLERFGLHWSSTILRGLRHLQRLDPDRVMPIAYEDLVREPTSVVRRLAAFLEVAAPDDWVAAAGASARPHASAWAALPEPERERLDATCRIANGRLYGPGGPPQL